ncbi:MAG: alpha/beta family hydrolase [Nakamurella sp.]
MTTSAPDAPTSVVLVLHGGAADSTRQVGPMNLAALRLIPVARAIAARVPTATVYRLRFAVRGWNGDGAVVLADARWAMEEITQRHPGLPVVVAGHSLGGRVAMHVVRHSPSVVGAVGLAPWVEPTDPVDGLRGVPLFVIQGTRDRIVPERSTRPWLARAALAGASIHSVLIDGGGHAMLRFIRRWHRLAADGVVSALAAAGRDSQPATDRVARPPVGRVPQPAAQT